MRIRSLTPLALCVLIAATAAISGRMASALAASGSISVTPASQTVAPGTTFVVAVTQNSDSATTGAEATISFDPSILQVRDVQPGPAYAAGSVAFGGADQAAQQAGNVFTPEEAVANANQTGTLVAVTAFIQPGGGSAPPGTNVFVNLMMQAVLPGTSPITLSAQTNSIGAEIPMQLLTDQYDTINVTGTDGVVTVDGAAPPPAGGTPPAGTPAPGSTSPAGTPPAANGSATVTISAGKTPAVTKTASTGVLGSSRAPSLTSASFSVSPATQKVAKESTFSFDVKQNVNGAAVNVQAAVTYKKDLAKIVKLEPGPGWKADSKALDRAISDANVSGQLDVTLTADKTNGPPTSGDSTILTVTMEGQPGKQGKSAIKLVSADITGADGSSVPVTTSDGDVTVGSASGGSSVLLIVLATLGAIAIVGGGGATYLMKRAKAS